MQLKGNKGIRAAGLVLVLLVVGTVPASAQVPQDFTFSGRLVDDLGVPLPSPQSITVFICQDSVATCTLYVDRFNDVPLDAQGNFSVLLGTAGLPPFDTFDVGVFTTAVDPHVEVWVSKPNGGFDILSPRVPLSSVPAALVAQQANEIVPDSSAPRFEGCGDGTVADHQTGLQWEKKTGSALDPIVFCGSAANCPDPHIVNNFYRWSATGTAPDGIAFTDFLARLNGTFDPDAATGCFADHCDWRLPKISELQTIMRGPEAAPGQSQTCFTQPCIDWAFANIPEWGGPTALFRYSSSSTDLGDPTRVWYADFTSGYTSESNKVAWMHVGAVRTGSCN